jgi:hypothetical protein
MTGLQGTPAGLFYDFCLDEHVPFDHLLGDGDRPLALDDIRHSPKAVLQPDGSALSRSRSEDTHADRWLMRGHSVLGAASAMRSLHVASEWMAGSRSLDILEKPTRALSRERHAAPARGGGGQLRSY